MQRMTETSNRPLPQVTDRATWQARIDELRVKEKAHARAGGALWVCLGPNDVGN
jgi:hypothetical protein